MTTGNKYYMNMNNISSVWTNDMFLVTHSEEKRQTANGNDDDVFDDVSCAAAKAEAAV